MIASHRFECAKVTLRSGPEMAGIICSMARSYSEFEKAEARALAAAIGPVKASEKLGIPRRTVSYWMHQPAASAIIAAAEQDIADQLRASHALALAEVTAGLRDPKARLGDKAAALRILGEQLALAEGRATSNTNINVSQRPPDRFLGLNDEETRDLVALLDNEIFERQQEENADVE